jgi:DNA-directed RNA polymerase specialized sigma subunit
MRYYEQDIKAEKPARNTANKIVGNAPKEESLEYLTGKGVDFAAGERSVEDDVVLKLMADKLHNALKRLEEAERELITALFFSNDGEGMSEREYSAQSGIPRKTLSYRKKKIFDKLKLYL